MLFRQATLLLSVAAALSFAHAAGRKLSKKNQPPPDDDCITFAEAYETVGAFMATVDAISKGYYAARGKFDCSITD